MPTLEGLRRKIDTAKDLSSVVTTMKTLAAVRIRQYEQSVEALTEYNRTIELGFHVVLREQPSGMETIPVAGRTGAVVFGTDQGMCGQFNEELVSFVHTRYGRRNQVREHPWLFLVVGTRAEGSLLDVGLTSDQSYPVPTSVSDIGNLVHEIFPRIERWRAESNVCRLFVFYNRRTSASSYESQQQQLLPLDPERLHGWRHEPWRSRSLPAMAIEQSRLLSILIRQYLFASLFRACAESLASENASRIAAMQAAENNIRERLEELRGYFNQLRQSAIPEELLDIVTGFEALAKQRRAVGLK